MSRLYDAALRLYPLPQKEAGLLVEREIDLDIRMAEAHSYRRLSRAVGLNRVHRRIRGDEDPSLRPIERLFEYGIESLRIGHSSSNSRQCTAATNLSSLFLNTCCPSAVWHKGCTYIRH